MRKRSRRSANNSESTGKIGQEIPSNQPRPLVPLYPDAPQAREAGSTKPVAFHHQSQATTRAAHSPGQDRHQQQEWNEPAGSGRLEVETQPEQPSMPDCRDRERRRGSAAVA